MNIGHDRDVAAALAQSAHDVLQVGRVFHRGRRDPYDLAPRLRQFDGLCDGRFRIHGVAGNHRLYPDGIVAPDANIPDAHLT
jgi:hypothetical protein